MPVVRCLSMHAQYGCERTGVCCSSNWPVPVEADRLWQLEAAMTAGRLTPAAGSAERALTAPPPAAPPSVAGVLGRHRRRCVFLQSVDGHSCRVHARLGHDALPLACRQFPRVLVRDPRGVSITLSHYCPTASAMLTPQRPLTIVSSPAAFPDDGEYDALDASMAMPPLLHPDMMMDWTAWWEWERLALVVLTAPVLGTDPDPALALGRLNMAVEDVRRWRPSDGPLIARVRRSLESARAAHVEPFAPDAAEIAARLHDIIAATPSDVAAEHQATIDTASATTAPDVTARFLAAHAFASWHMQLGRGLRTWLRSIEAAAVLLRAGLDVRHADLWLRHLVDVTALARRWSESEDG